MEYIKNITPTKDGFDVSKETPDGIVITYNYTREQFEKELNLMKRAYLENKPVQIDKIDKNEYATKLELKEFEHSKIKPIVEAMEALRENVHYIEQKIKNNKK